MVCYTTAINHFLQRSLYNHFIHDFPIGVPSLCAEAVLFLLGTGAPVELLVGAVLVHVLQPGRAALPYIFSRLCLITKS